jgi:hypothetical protein
MKLVGEIGLIGVAFSAWVVPAWFAARIANRKGREGANYFVAAFFVSGVVALIVALAVRPVDSRTDPAPGKAGRRGKAPEP